ncbi:MAG: hypothetical protein A3E83_04525 [Gammaproteobacteria bacterium RIFCSPHIGHO2_12_FULL_41_20]|nr:MAG: hypothetical protein A3E83_04525 [Gammaproteobacteria bacterium RIFCSPHIGHO2_12_FULL_41_20]
MNKKIMTSIKLQKKLHHTMLQRIISDGYGMRGKSRWIIEAVDTFLSLPDYPELVDIANDMDQLTEVVSIRVPEQTVIQIEQAIIQVRKFYPAMEGVKSSLIRASIIQRLIREVASVAEV